MKTKIDLKKNERQSFWITLLSLPLGLLLWLWGDRADHHGYCLRNDPTVAPGIDTHQARLIFTFVI